MSDGETTVGRPNELATRAASEAKVQVSTIAFGTDAGYVVVEGRNIPVPVNRDALAAIETPVPVQQHTTPRSASPAATSSPTRRPTSGHGSSSIRSTSWWPAAARAAATSSAIGVPSSLPKATLIGAHGTARLSVLAARTRVYDG